MKTYVFLCTAILMFGMASFSVEAGKPVCTDGDNDTYSPDGKSCGPVDCNDSNAVINPGAIEACSDTIDNDCDGFIDSADPDCNVSCTPTPGEETQELSCSDGVDNDCDSFNR